MTKETCDLSQLDAFTRGELSEQAEMQLAEHLDQCETCGDELEVRVAERIAAQIAAGLAAAHEQGLVHRDIKPANILLGEGVERVTITDFGLARAVDDASMTRSGVIAGTPQYMSPEQTRGEAIEARSDLFSLGSVLYAMCAGRSPFRAETTYGVLHRIANHNPTPICDVNSDVPAWLSHIIERLMAKQADDRFASAAEVAELLADCLAHVQQPTTVPLPERCGSLVKRHNEDQRTAAGPRFPRQPPATVVRLVMGAAAALALIFAGILIVLELNKGTLTIESNGDHDIPIRIIRGDEVVERLTVTQDEATTRLKAGEYVVEIDSGITGYELTGNQVTLKRSENWIAKITKTGEALDAGFPSDAVLQEIHDLLAEETRLKVDLRYVQQFLEGGKLFTKTDASQNLENARREKLIEARQQEITNRLKVIHESELGDLRRVAENATLECSEEPHYGQPSYGVIVYAKTRDRIQKDELLLFHAGSLYRTRGTIRPLRTTGNGFFLRPNVAIPADRHIALACIQDAKEENENVKNGIMPDSDRARNPSRAYRANVFDRQSGKPIQSNEHSQTIRVDLVLPHPFRLHWSR
ncbi:protein kinase domain-containing protein [Novipirellula sp. SH528]|uniref:serine/threonine protein kinase n=1 Tax=Novipirellula sp. SH528 TaxID=3454466 RepID=UPI003F9EE19B